MNTTEKDRIEELDANVWRAIGFTNREMSPITYVEYFLNVQPVYYTSSRLWYIWNEQLRIWELVDETDILNAFRKAMDDHKNTVTRKKDLIEALKQVARERKPKTLGKEWVQFGKRLYRISDGKNIESTPKLFSTNAIPHEPGESDYTPTIDKLFTEWVGEKYVPTLYEIIAYACYRAYPIQTAFVFEGSGRNGKSQYLKLIRRFIGLNNCVSTDFDKITSNNYETFSLYQKNIALMGETNYTHIKNTSIIKQLVGGDLIRFEKKFADSFSAENYAKLLIATNNLPTSDDNSDGFFRKWIIISFPNQFKEGKDIIESIPPKEYNNLARKVLKVLPVLLNKGEFTGQGTPEERRDRYLKISNPIEAFIKENYDTTDPNASAEYQAVYQDYNSYLYKQGKRNISWKQFTEALIRANLETRRIHDNEGKIRVIDGIRKIIPNPLPGQAGQQGQLVLPYTRI